ncbi:MAG: hypothetical protein RL199_644 [Pseudomonadota bacterium]|jgi:hypothetical protein
MGRVINPDYFKVGAGTAGSGVSKLGRFDDDHSRLSATLARLHREAPHQVAATLEEVERKKTVVKRSVPTGAFKRRPPSAASRSETGAVIELFHTSRPAHGRKRRSVKKRHEVAVLRSIAAAREPAAPRPPDRPPRGRREAWRTLAVDLLDFAKELALTPIALARILSRLKREERQR